MTARAFIAGCSGPVLTPEETAFFRAAEPWGFILFRRNVDTPEQVRALCASLRETVGRADAPILIDQEGGRVARLRPPVWPAFPPAEPESVLLNFLLYTDSDELTCPGNCPLTIKADAEVVWPERSADAFSGPSYSWRRGSVPHSSATLEDGRVVETMAAESFSAEVPYDTFLDIISAKRVVVRLGPDWVELTADQIEALREMHRRLPRQPPPDDSYSY